MNEPLQKLEADVERELRAWSQRLAAPVPSDELLERVKVAVRAEAQRSAGNTWFDRRVGSWLRPALAVAATVVLMVTFTMPTEQASLSVPYVTAFEDDPGETLGFWADALDESEDRLTRVARDGWWMLDPAATDTAAADDALLGLEDSLRAFEEIFGA